MEMKKVNKSNCLCQIGLLIFCIYFVLTPTGMVMAAPQDVSVHLMTDNLKVASSGEAFKFYFRWNGTDFYEFIFSDGTEVIVDPTYYKKATACYDITKKVTTEVADIHGCDYILLSHTHNDHDNKIAEIYKTYKEAVVVVPGNSAAAFVVSYGITPSQNVVIPANGGGDRLVMPNLRLTSYTSKHTYLRGVNPDSPTVYIKDVLTDKMTLKEYHELVKSYSGNEDLLSYDITANDGFKIFLWNGALLNDYRLYQYAGIEPDIMFYQQAACNIGGDRTKPDSTDLTNFISTIKPKLAIPNHQEYFTMENLYKIGDQMVRKSNEIGLKTDYLEPVVLQWYGVSRLSNGKLEVKVVDDAAVPSKRMPVRKN